MDYEFKIKVLEKELAHFREMQALFQSHEEAHDTSIDSVLERVEKNLDRLSAAQLITEQKITESNRYSGA